MKTEKSNEWTLISNSLPKAGQKVLVCGIYRSGTPWRTTAKWHPAGTMDTSTWDEIPDDWVNDTNPSDEWVEESVEGEQSYFLENVMYWMPLPAFPNVKDEPDAQHP